FAIPQTSVVELVRASGNSEHTIEMINDAPVLRLRKRLLPLVSLRDLLALGDDDQGTGEGDGDGKSEEREAFIIVTSVGAYSIGLVVDKVYDTEEIVVKPVSPILRDIRLYSGNTILGDGSVIMILDPNGIAAATGEIAIADSQAKAEAAAQSARGDDRVALLIFRANGPEPKAVPLSLVARLEEVEVDKIETSNGMPVVQYRGQLMPLVPVSPDAEMKTEGRQPVVVFTDDDRSMGLVVDEIVDIVEDKMTVELAGEKPGLLGSAIIDGKATEILDAGYYLSIGQRDWFGTQGQQAAFGIDGGAKQVLLVDDSSFFRNLLAPMLRIAGYEVTTVESADDALSLRESGQEFDIIVSDIEMPGMDGFEFAETVKSEGSWQQTPLVALTSHATPKDFERGRAAGFDDYVAKFDRDALLTALSESLAMTGDAA
ncbi:MAG: chemotaxis protein CheW, partial [Acidimicrobiia bacterium]